MLKLQIKSILRNKTNIIYIIIFIILFTILNIFINFEIVVDDYYDLKVEEKLQNYLASFEGEENLKEKEEEYKKRSKNYCYK